MHPLLRSRLVLDLASAGLLLLAALLVLLVLLATSALISETVLAFAAPAGGFTARQVHGFVGYWVLAVVAIHIGLRWGVVMAAARQLFHVTTPSRLRSGLLRAIALGIVAAGVDSAGALGVRARLMFEMSLDWWNFEASVVGFFAHCALFAGALIVVSHYLQLLLHRRTARIAAPRPAAAPIPTQPEHTP